MAELEPLPDITVVMRRTTAAGSDGVNATETIVVWRDVDLPERWGSGDVASRRLRRAIEDALREADASGRLVSLTHSGQSGSAGAVVIGSVGISIDVGAVVLAPAVAITSDGGPAFVVRQRVRLTASAGTSSPSIAWLGDLLGTLEHRILAAED